MCRPTLTCIVAHGSRGPFTAYDTWGYDGEEALVSLQLSTFHLQDFQVPTSSPNLPTIILTSSYRLQDFLRGSSLKQFSLVEWSGVEWSGVEWSGVEWSGVEWSGVESSLVSSRLLSSRPRLDLVSSRLVSSCLV